MVLDRDPGTTPVRLCGPSSAVARWPGVAGCGAQEAAGVAWPNEACWEGCLLQLLRGWGDPAWWEAHVPSLATVEGKP